MEYIEPSYPVTLPTQSPTAPAIVDAGSGSGDSNGIEVVPENIQPTTTTIEAVTSQADSSVKVTPVTTNQPMPTTVDPTVPTTVTCSKLRGDLLSVNNYLVMFQHDLPSPRMNELYALLKSIKEVDLSFDMNEMKPIFRGPVKGFYYNGLRREAIMMVR